MTEPDRPDGQIDLTSLANHLRAVLALAGLDSDLMVPYEHLPAGCVQIELEQAAGEPNRNVWVKWQSSARLRDYHSPAVGLDRLEDPMDRFRAVVTGGMGKAIADLLSAAGFDAAYGVNGYDPAAVRVSGYTANEVGSMAATAFHSGAGEVWPVPPVGQDDRRP
ncbi:hypothetical protein ACQP2X_30120 [Actinoplanes sp. CA-131856]